MKSDMGGAASVAGAVLAAAELGLEVGVRAVLPLAENMPGGRAIRPGDVLRHPDGRTSEVTDTDCEGRLVLADAIAYLAGQDVAGIVDVGTLTDGGGVGHALWGAWGTDPGLVRDLLAAGTAAGEPGWQLPLVPSYVELMRSRVADIANCSRQAPTRRCWPPRTCGRSPATSRGCTSTTARRRTSSAMPTGAGGRHRLPDAGPAAAARRSGDRLTAAGARC